MKRPPGNREALRKSPEKLTLLQTRAVQMETCSAELSRFIGGQTRHW